MATIIGASIKIVGTSIGSKVGECEAAHIVHDEMGVVLLFKEETRCKSHVGWVDDRRAPVARCGVL